MNPGYDAAAARLRALLELMATLRDPARGCPWDRAQDFASIVPHTLEEAYELADAIAGGEPARIRDELGDLLFQVVFLAQLGDERGWFGFADVAAGLEEKLRRRHPHVFDAGHAPAADAQAVAGHWESHKATERLAAGQAGALDGVPVALPALSRAAKVSRRAARVGFDWRNEVEVRAKIAEELRETEQAIGAGDAAAVAEELGDVLFAVVNWARQLQVEPEAALRNATLKFERRFREMERLVALRGLAPQQLDADAWESLWQEAKRAGG